MQSCAAAPQGLFQQGHHSPCTSLCCACACAPCRTAMPALSTLPTARATGWERAQDAQAQVQLQSTPDVHMCDTHVCKHTHSHMHGAPSSAFPPRVSAAFLAAGAAWLRARACSCSLHSFLPSFPPSLALLGVTG